ncbi:MAG: TadE family protein [Actinomycetota bacterium]
MNERGQTTVELALCLPIVALVLAAVVEIGLVVSDQARVWHAAREAARVAAVEDDEREIGYAAARSGLDNLDITVTPDALHRRQGAPVTVSLTYRPEGRVPMLGELFQRFALHGSASMRIEQP